MEAFGDIFDSSCQSMLMNGENEEGARTFAYICSVIVPSTDCEPEINQRLAESGARRTLRMKVDRCVTIRAFFLQKSKYCKCIVFVLAKLER